MTRQYQVSDALRLAVLVRRSQGIRQFQIAREAQVNPATFSAIVSGLLPIRYGDPRVLRIARVLNVPAADAFDLADTNTEREA